MSQESFWILLSKKLSGEASPEELLHLENLILSHPEWQLAIQNLTDLWKHQPLKDSVEEEDAYMLHLHRMDEMNIPFSAEPAKEAEIFSTSTSSKAKWYWAAAAILLVATGFLAFANPFKKEKQTGIVRQVSEITTRPGSKSKVELPDGSVVWLNAGSKLTYNKDFGKELREVTLSGEGYFDVVKNKEKPFVIHTSSINIKVLGTLFNVKAYPEDKQTETSLIRGSIEVTIKNRPEDKIILSPSEKLVVENASVPREEKIKKPEIPVRVEPLISVNKLRYNPLDSTVAETEWVNNRLVFRDETFENLAVKMERWYDVSISIEDPALKDARLNGIFQSESVVQALEALKEMIPFKYEKTENKIIIHH